MSYGTAKERRDRYVESMRRAGAEMPNDDQIEAITGYVPLKKRLRTWGIALFLGLMYAGISFFSR